MYMIGRVLVEAGADLNICNESGCFGTSLHYAIMKVNINKKNSFIKFSANHSCNNNGRALDFTKIPNRKIL